MTLEVFPRPCDRCAAGNLAGISEYDDTEIQTPMCAEFHMAYGVVAWLCFDCRVSWYKEIEKLEAATEYEKAQFKLEFWKARVCKESTNADLEEGLSLLEEASKLESAINAHAYAWLIGS